MAMNAGSVSQPSGVLSPEDSTSSLTRTQSIPTIDGAEPRMFPGVVSRRRRSSIRNSLGGDGDAKLAAMKKESVVEEPKDGSEDA